LLLAATVIFQTFSGALLLIRRRRPDNWTGILQGASGAYLMLFFASHISAVIRTRYLHHAETNWVWLTSSNLFTDWWSSRLVPYYFLGIVGLSVHGACGLRWILQERGKTEAARWSFGIITAAGGIVATAVMIAVVGASLRYGH
jgi:succinate dehydrogenase/fumarate reductase cytochrome b subunit